MVMMGSSHKSLHLTRQEAWVVFSLVGLLSALMFSIGLWIGLEQSGSQVAHVPYDSGREPASHALLVDEGHQDEVLPGQRLRDEFIDSKQQALAEAMGYMSRTGRPTSALRARAHQLEAPEASRAPAADQRWSDDEARLAKLREAEEQRKKAGPAAEVKNLFERSPAAVSDFEPTPGSYTVQLASFATEDESIAMVRNLREQGFLDAYTHEVKFKNGEIWYRVAMGSYPNPVYARQMGERIKRRGLSSDFIVRKVQD